MYSLPQILFSSSSMLLDPGVPDGPETQILKVSSGFKDHTWIILLADGRGSLPRLGWLGSRPSDEQRSLTDVGIRR